MPLETPDAPPNLSPRRAPRESFIAPRPSRSVVATGLRVSETLVMNAVWCDVARVRGKLPSAVVARVLTPVELLEATIDPALDIEPEFAPHALDKGDRCVGVFVDGKLASYGFYARSTTDIAFGLSVAWSEPTLRYMYKGYTLPSHRGRGLYGLGLLAGALLLRREGVRLIFAFIRRGNEPSLAAAMRAGYRVDGLFVGTRHFGGRGYLSTSPRARGLSIVRST